MASADPVRLYVRRILQPYIDNALKKEASKSLPKPAIGTVFIIEDANESVIYTRAGYLKLNAPTKIYYQTLQDWCNSVGANEEDIKIGE
jgi:hypothetical protein